MIQPIKDNRRKNAIKKLPKPCWVEAFMIMLLHERAILKQKLTGKPHSPEITLNLSELRRFEELKGGNKTKFTFDSVAETVTLTAPEAIMPEESKIVHNTGIVGPN